MTLKEIKTRAQFFRQGHIIPTRILRCSIRKKQYLFQFGCDVWTLPMPKGYLIIQDEYGDKNPSAIHIRKGPGWGGKMHIQGSPYHKDGRTEWVGNFRLTPEEFLQRVEAAIKRMS